MKNVTSSDGLECPKCFHSSKYHESFTAFQQVHYACEYMMTYKPWWSKWKREKRCGCNFSKNMIRINTEV